MGGHVELSPTGTDRRGGPNARIADSDSVNHGSNPGPSARESASNRCVFVVSSLAGTCRTFTANAVRLHALAYNLGNFLRTLAGADQGLVADESEGEAHQDWGEGRHMWTALHGKHFFGASNDLVGCGHMSGLCRCGAYVRGP